MLTYRNTIFFALLLFFGIAAIGQQRIHLNQSGFYVHAPKIAIVSGQVQPGNFYVLRGSDTVFKGTLSDTITALYSSGPTRVADFSAFNKPGNYVLFIQGLGNSYPFAIKN